MPHSASKSTKSIKSSRTSSGGASSSIVPAPFYCHTCGRHTSHTAQLKVSSADPSTTSSSSSEPNVKKHCSQRCKSEPRASAVIGLVWREMLDEGQGSGKGGRVVLCKDVQARVFDEGTGRPRLGKPVATGSPHLERGNESLGAGKDGKEAAEESKPETSTSPPSAQALGMLNASNRELIRRSARLLVHFGFPHLAAKRSRMFPLEWETEAIERLKEEGRGVKGVGWDGKVVEDVTHQKGEWGLKWKEAV